MGVAGKGYDTGVKPGRKIYSIDGPGGLLPGHNI